MVGGQGRLGPGAQNRAGRRDIASRLGACLSAPRRRRSRQCRLLVPKDRQASRDRFSRSRVGSHCIHTARECKRMSAKNSKLIKGSTGDWEVVIGMEVHAQVTSNAKLFSGASTEFGGEPNSHVSLVDAAMPGMLPVINEECARQAGRTGAGARMLRFKNEKWVRQAVRTGLGLNAKINLRSVFDRKNYFYPDLPQGYQISQFKSPIVREGEGAGDAA